MELPIGRRREKDRNFSNGGRSFYFFDFDDNIAYLSTVTFVFHKETGDEIALSSGEFANQSPFIGKSGAFKDYEIRYDDASGTFRMFRDKDLSKLQRLLGQKQLFEKDLLEALGLPDYKWKGPSWDCFYHAVFNNRPTALITARGHYPETLKKGIRQFVNHGFLPHEPNYLGVYPVSNIEVRQGLGASANTPISELKQRAIRTAVVKAFDKYGHNPYHRFGMSDDDPKNITLIIEEMYRLKSEFPDNSFFVIETHKGQFYKREIFKDHMTSKPIKSSPEQLSLFRKS